MMLFIEALEKNLVYADSIWQENGFFGEDTYLWQRYKFNISFGAETENVITLKCGDIEKEYFLIVDQL
jgi:hypothetical protein